MADAATKLAVKTEATPTDRPKAPDLLRPFESLRREMNRLFDDFGPFGRSLFGLEPYAARDTAFSVAPRVDVVEGENEYEITAELPGIEERDVEVKVSNGTLTIRGEKKEEKEERKKDFYLSERRYGSFQRSFAVPEGVDADKIEATFKKGVLTVVLPKTAEALKQEKKIAVKPA
jgi:HSP20 family protein